MERLDKLLAGTKVPAKRQHDIVWLNRNVQRYIKDTATYAEVITIVRRLMRKF
jgi:hypothetical protein